MSIGKIIAIDIGHNVGCDTGAVGIRREDELNKLVGEAVISKCMNNGINVIRCLPKSASSLYDSLNQRCKTANNYGADFFVSIHHNACPGGQGAEVLLIKGGVDLKSKEQVGNAILVELNSLGLANRGLKDRRNLFVLTQTTMPAILVECAFCDSPKDMENYNTEKVAEAIFRGITLGLNIKVASSESSEDNYYVVAKGDTLWGISTRFKTTVDNIVRLNGIKDRNLIHVGDRLKIR